MPLRPPQKNSSSSITSSRAWPRRRATDSSGRNSKIWCICSLIWWRSVKKGMMVQDIQRSSPAPYQFRTAAFWLKYYCRNAKSKIFYSPDSTFSPFSSIFIRRIKLKELINLQKTRIVWLLKKLMSKGTWTMMFCSKLRDLPIICFRNFKGIN